jgi:hypothetical protein
MQKEEEMSRAVMQMALEALEQFRDISDFTPASAVHAITALRAALAEPEQEPVAWMWKDGTVTADPDRADGTWTPLYTAPPQRKWVGLIEQDFSAINQSCLTKLQAATSAESILKEKNA